MSSTDKCGKCGCWNPVCRCDGRSVPGMHVWKPMWYNDICETPLYIESKRELRREWKKHDVTACRLM